MTNKEQSHLAAAPFLRTRTDHWRHDPEAAGYDHPHLPCPFVGELAERWMAGVRIRREEAERRERRMEWKSKLKKA